MRSPISSDDEEGGRGEGREEAEGGGAAAVGRVPAEKLEEWEPLRSGKTLMIIAVFLLPQIYSNTPGKSVVSASHSRWSSPWPHWAAVEGHHQRPYRPGDP